MLNLIKSNKIELNKICKSHKVSELFLFGSATTINFDIEKSDLDFVVKFNNSLDLLDYADNFFSLMDSLKILFNKKIDLLSLRALKNEVIISEVEKTKVLLYAS